MKKIRFPQAALATSAALAGLLASLTGAWPGTPALAGSSLAQASPPQSGTYPSATVELEGHGFGHGRGLGQFGALGYALGGQHYTQILDHYYGGTTPGTVPDAPISVHMTGYDGAATTVIQEHAHLTTPAAPGQFAALRATLTGPNTFRIDKSNACGGPWAPLVASLAGPVVFSPGTPTPAASVDRSELLQTCFPDGGGTRWLRGSIQAVDGGNGGPGDQRTVDVLPIEDYLQGSVPRESPASWGDLGSGAGMEALKAQAVAGRSYASASNLSSFARICDTTACQVYGGRAVQINGAFTDLEDPRSTAAVVATAGQVRMLGGGVARTEYSSSTGGYSAGGAFPAVVDSGDSVALNVNHAWDVTVAVADLQAAYPSIGSLVSIAVTSRNGLGDMGGRVLRMSIVGTQGTVTPSGDDFAAALNLRSNWFQVVYPQGYWVVGTDGGIYSFGRAGFFGSAGATHLNKPIVGMAASPSGSGYWLVASDGGIFNYGDAGFLGSAGGIHLNKPIVGMAATPSGRGYWLVASDGGIFNYGDAGFLGSAGGIHLNKPIVGMAATPSGRGYWLVASDGGIFRYGDAGFFGSAGGIHLNQPVVAMAATQSGNGYWLVASDGGVFNYGPDATLFGSAGGIHLNQPVVGMDVTPAGHGYWLVASDGGIFNYGDAGQFGSVPGVVKRAVAPIVGIAAFPAPPH